MELRQIRYFIAVAEELSFSGAARRINVSQPPLSRQIAKLEEELAVKLFERNNRSVSLTPSGRFFLENARSLMNGLEEAATTARRAAEGEIGTLAVGFGGTAAFAVLPAILKKFRAKYPAVLVSLEQLPLIDQIAALRHGRIDVGFVSLPFKDRSIAYEAIMRDRLVVAAPSDHPLAQASKVHLKELGSFDFIGFSGSDGFAYQSHTLEICRRANIVPRIVKETAPMVSVIGLVASGLGIAIVPSLAQRLHIAEVRYLPIKDKHAYIDFAFAWNKDNRSPVLVAFLALARQTAIGAASIAR